MKLQPLSIIIIIMALFSLSCTNNKWPAPNEIAIGWEVVSNTHDPDEAKVKAQFTIKNNSKTTLTDTNWQLFYNQSPRFLLNIDAAAKAGVEQISGDWYTIYPRKGFSLHPGEETTINYESRFWWIKESDAPKGFYFVFTDEQGHESIVEVNDVNIRPFERPEQLSRHLRDRVEVPSAERRYIENNRLKEIPAEQLIPIIPNPASFESNGKYIIIDPDVKILHDAALQKEALHLQNMLFDLFGLQIETADDDSSGGRFIRLELADEIHGIPDDLATGISKEAYGLQIMDDGNMLIRAKAAKGVFYGIQSLLALFPLEAFAGKSADIRLPQTEIADYPRFSYRGVHIDVARNFFPKETIFKMLDILSFYKINTLHLHLTDDEGWRLEIAALPELTAVGGQRSHTTREASALHPAFGSGPHAYAPGSQGSGYFSRHDYIEILQYAQARHIRVIPEINLPGHARAAIKAMEARHDHFMQQGDEQAANEYRLIDPNETSEYLSAQLFTDNVVNVARESVYHFFKTVLDEVIDIYREAGAPLEIIHVGGDEVPRGAWSASPMINKKLAELDHISSHQNMHAYFTERILEITSARGLIVAGWEEVALVDDRDGKHVPNTAFAGGQLIPYVWNNLWGSQDLAYRLANAGFPVVLSHVTAFYFDLAYNKDPKEPGLYWGGFVNTRSAWHYNPYDVFKTTLRDNMGRAIDIEAEYRHMERLLPEARQNILGVQAQLWSETIVKPKLLEYYLLPKLLGFTETAWAQPHIWESTEDEDLRAEQTAAEWKVFAATLGQRELHRLSYLFGGYNYRIPLPGAVVENGLLKANIEFPGLMIRYTTDGSEPDARSTLYERPVEVLANQIVKLRAFDVSGRGGRTVSVFQ